MQEVYNYIPETNHVSRVDSFAATLYFFYIFNNLDWGPVPRFAPWKHYSQCGLLHNSPFF